MDINFEPFIEWDNSYHSIERFLSKAQKTTLTLSLLQQQAPRRKCPWGAHLTPHSKKVYAWK